EGSRCPEIGASSQRVHKRGYNVLSTPIPVGWIRQLKDDALWFRNPNRYFQSGLIENVAGVIMEDRFLGVHEIDVEAVAVVQIFEAILSRMAKIASTVCRGSEPLTFLLDVPRGSRNKIVLPSLGQNSIQSGDDIGGRLVTAPSGRRRVVRQEYAGVVDDIVRPDLRGQALHTAGVEPLGESNHPGVERPLPLYVPEFRRREIEAIDQAIAVRVGFKGIRGPPIQARELVGIGEPVPVRVGVRRIRLESVLRRSIPL